MSRHNPIDPEIVAMIRDSPEGDSAIARRLGISRQTVAKIRAGQIHRSDPRATKEESIRLVLAQSPDTSLATIAELTGLDKDTVRRIRLGLRFANVAPELPRMTLEQSQRRCWACVQWDSPIGSGGSDRYGRCNLEIPEATQPNKKPRPVEVAGVALMHPRTSSAYWGAQQALVARVPEQPTQ